MIQRIQSLYLLIAAAMLVLFVSLGRIWATGVSAEIAWLGPVAYGLGVLTAVAALVAVALFKTRERQRSVIGWTMWLDLALVAAVLVGLFATAEQAPEAGGPYGRYLVALLPVTAYLLLRLARAGVHRDIGVVKSMDRLR